MQKNSINTFNPVHAPRNQTTPCTSKFVLLTPLVKKNETYSNKKNKSDIGLNWYSSRTNSTDKNITVYPKNNTPNITTLFANTTLFHVTKQVNHKTSTKRAFFWYFKKRNLNNQTDFVYSNESISTYTKIENTTKLSNMTVAKYRKVESLKYDNQKNETSKPRHHIPKRKRPLIKKLNRLIRLMKSFKKSLPLEGSNSTRF